MRPASRSGASAKIAGRGVAAGGCNELRSLQLGSEQLGQAVDEFVEELGAGVLGSVPLGVERLVVETEVGTEVDDVAGLAANPGNDAHADTVWEPAEHHVEPIDRLRGVCVEAAIAVRRGQARVQVGDRLSGHTVAGRHLQIEVGVGGEQPQQFGAGVARCSDDAD